MAPGGSLVSPGRGLVPRVPAPPPPSQPHGAMLPEGVPPPPNRGAGGFVWLPIAANAMPRGAGAPELPSGVPPPQRSTVGMAPPQHHYPMGAPGLSRPISKKQRADGSTTVRATFSEAQLQGLDAAYAVNAYPSADDRNVRRSAARTPTHPHTPTHLRHVTPTHIMAPNAMPNAWHPP